MNDTSPAVLAPPPVGRRGGQTVLMLEFDLFGAVGGGQTVYQRIIALRPSDTFYYFRNREAADALRPPNAVAIPFAQTYRALPNAVPGTLHGSLLDYTICRNLAASILRSGGPRAFDVVDVPDFRPVGALVRPAFAAEGIEVETVALALHGTLSTAFRLGWPTGQSESRVLAELRVKERLQYRVADARYAISQRYAGEWGRTIPGRVNLLDPLCVVPARTAPAAAPQGGAPDLAFVGRREKWKGPDLFLTIAWCLDPSLYNRLMLIGPDGPNRVGVGSETALASIAKLRDIKVQMPGALSRAELSAMFAGRSLLLMPSRYDTFNLTALEAIQAGCPTIVSSRAGVADWFKQNLPDLDWLTSDIDCGQDASHTVANVLRDYDRHRETLLDCLARRPLHDDGESVGGIYTADPNRDAIARQQVVELANLFEHAIVEDKPNAVQAVRRQILAPLRTPPARAMRETVAEPLRANWARVSDRWRDPVLLALTVARYGMRNRLTRDLIKTQISAKLRVSPRAVSQLIAGRSVAATQRRMLWDRPRTTKGLDARLAWLSSLVSDRLIDRVTLFREMARIERLRGNHQVAATYLLRTMRWLGGDPRGDLDYVTASLRDLGYVHEAAAADAMFGADTDSHARCLDLMRDALARNRSKPELPLAVLDDRRNGVAARVAVIASLYNAAKKLPVLLSMLANQSLAERGELEVVLVDSNSPADERGAMEAFLASRSIPVVYARSAERETIQAAWNRGIRLARAPYLAFLGADEGLHPDALRILAEQLDAAPDIDWVMADSVVTNVDRHGVFDSDVMPYDRTGYRQEFVYLDTTYLSWVGGLYRRSIHDRFGYYDESYRAAGDTEFKNRLLPYIRTLHVPKMLGVFNNYPEERTTASPRAEIEDLRAWYLWRTAAGMEYAFGAKPAEEAIALLRASLRYRKAFCGHISSDFDLAHSIAEHLAARSDTGGFGARAVRETWAALKVMQRLELWPGPRKQPETGLELERLRGMKTVWDHFRSLRALATAHRQALDLPETPIYEAFNDNRYEQHWWSWSVV